MLLQQNRPVAYASKCLTETEGRYAQLEKEMLAIVFACKKCIQYIYGKPNIIIHTDHKPLIRIIKKPLNDISTRLQKMRLRLQQYDIKLECISGKDIKIADTLSRDLQRKKELEDFLPEVVNAITLAITEDKKNKIKDQTNKDEICTKLIEYTEEGWPNKNEIQETIMSYYSIRNTITHIDGLIFKDQLLIVPNTLRKEMMQQAHAVHGIGSCRRRLRNIAYWPGINNDIENYITTCPSCIKHSEIQNKKKPLLQHARGETPWSKIGIDLCQLDNRILIIVIDYYSNFLSVEKLSITTSKELKRY